MKSDDFVDMYIKRAVRLNRAFDGASAEQAKKLSELHASVLLMIKREYGFLSARKLEDLNRTIAKAINKEFNGRIIPELHTISEQVIAKEIVWSGHVVEAVVIGYHPQLLNSEAVARRVLEKPFQGATFDTWFRNTGAKTTRGISGVLMRGYIEGQPTETVVQEVSNLLSKNTADVRTLTRSYLQASANEAREEFFDSNQDIVAGYQWLSTLDHRTTWHICGVRDQARYTRDKKPIGHNLPWGSGPGNIHFNCRSASVPMVKGVDFGPAERPVINAGDSYERGDNKTKTGKVRKPTKPNREKGIFKVGQTTTKTKFEDFLKRQPVDYIADVLGSKEKALAFKNGGKSLKELAAEKLSPIHINDL